ncbi:glutaredoxin domain-containing cysteine-rich protein CG31559-like isoform X3 [Biomphalaria glabrata]|uniref:Glutaredoxin domain-containing cysteine-rich protein CG31559-like isoform X3 n=1 Tax=Biomphalaria glabrata TaxID=6526 RepID=A0A9W3B6U7_BIOGL|nr:glutaredoxin domain-containing cysteine-rich protein CG31559-like isoform X3 [Biomphalaria glabrata]
MTFVQCISLTSMNRNSFQSDTPVPERMKERHQTSDRISHTAVDGYSRPMSEDLSRHTSQHYLPGQKGGYTTSIVVDAPAKQTPVVTVRQNQGHVPAAHPTHVRESSSQHRQSGGVVGKFPRSVSEPHDQESMYPAVLQKRYSNISEGRPHKHHTISVSHKQHNGIYNGIQEHPTHPHISHAREDLAAASVRTLEPTHFRNTHSNGEAHTQSTLPEAALSPTSRQFTTQPSLSLVPSAPPLFAGRRDVKDPSTVSEKQIVSDKGTVRGFKNRVRAGIATFWTQAEDTRNYRLLEQGKIVVYATSMSVVRETSERCKIVRSLLQNHMVRYEERDLYMSRDIQQELRERLAKDGITDLRLPHVFADGIHLGGSEELERLNEAGELRHILDAYQKIVVRIMCDKCGGYRFVPCDFCHGSKKSLLRNHFTEEFCALRCMHCDDNGLRRCDMCVDQQE